MSNSLWPHELQHARPPSPLPTPGVYSNSCPLSLWCHPTVSSSVVPFSSCPQSLPASGSFPMSQSFASGGQSIGASASASVFPMNIQDWSPLGWIGWVSLPSKGLSSLLQHHSSKASILWHSAFFTVQLLHPDTVNKYWCRDLPGGPVVKNMAVNLEDVNSVQAQGLRFHMPRQLSLCATTVEAAEPRLLNRGGHHNEKPTHPT